MSSGVYLITLLKHVYSHLYNMNTWQYSLQFFSNVTVAKLAIGQTPLSDEHLGPVPAMSVSETVNCEPITTKTLNFSPIRYMTENIP